MYDITLTLLPFLEAVFTSLPVSMSTAFDNSKVLGKCEYYNPCVYIIARALCLCYSVCVEESNGSFIVWHVYVYVRKLPMVMVTLYQTMHLSSIVLIST